MRIWAIACWVWLATAASFADTSSSNLQIALASSVENTGLGSKLAAGFATSCSCNLRYIAAGSTRALLLLASGEVAAAITHAPELEQHYLAEHPDTRRIAFMRNEFILVGPPADPAATGGLSTVEALAAIATGKARFISRADGSGTNLAELGLWQQALGEVPARSNWYRHAGVQMANALLVTSQLGAYTISDSGTFAYLGAGGTIASRRLSQDEPPLANTYSLIMPATENELVDKLGIWLRSDAARTIIKEHSVEGESLFDPLP